MTTSNRSPEHQFFEAIRLMQEGQSGAAEDAFRHALRLDPDLAEAHANLALLLERRGGWEEAEAHYHRALELRPQEPAIRLNFGAMLAGRKRLAEAEAEYLNALSLDPSSPAAWSNLGVLLACKKRDPEAEDCYRTALELVPGYAKAEFNLAYLLLRQGRYEEGWRCFEARDWNAPLDGYFQFPRWNGEPLQDKSVLIGFEGGHGDMIQFCRYARLMKESGAGRVSLLCHPGLKRLLSGLRGVDEVIGFSGPVAATGWDYWTPPMSLPLRFGTRLETIPATLPYLAADPVLARRWGVTMQPAGTGVRVGLAWSGNPGFENDADRSLGSSALLAPLAEVEGIRCFSLQVGAGADEIAPLAAQLSLTDLSSGIGDFADTAAIIANLDLVISVDTAVAHLAGALGKRCWVLLPHYKTDWRWLTDRDDSPWYPDVMRLFRQPRPGAWDEVIDAVKTELAALAGSFQR